MGFLLPGTLATLCSQCQAQALIPGGSLQDRFDSREPVSSQFGPLSIEPALQVDETFNDNIFATPTGHRADAITNVLGTSKIDYAEGANTGQFVARILDHIYAANPSETEWEGSVGGIYRHQVYDDLELNLGGNIQRVILPRTDPTGIGGLSPTTYWIYDAFSGAVYGDKLSNLMSIKFGATQTTFDSLEGLTGPINTSQRDFHEIYALGNLDHALFGQENKISIELRPNVRDYDHEFDVTGFRRSSSGGQVTIGGTLDTNAIFFVRLSTGLQFQKYDDPRFGTVTVPDGNIKVSWWPTLRSSLNLNLDHEYSEAFFLASPGAVENLASLELDHELQRNLIASVSATFNHLDVVESTANLQRLGGEAKLQYQLADGFVAVVDYAYTHQTASGGLTPFDQNLFTVSLKKLF
jgi:hypothetical protein